MSNPYRTPSVRLPAVPKATSATTYPKRVTSLKPPIINPYDKFTASEFDAWVSDLKGALKKALGRDDEIDAMPPAVDATEEAEVEMELEDSFADYRSRQSAKGKGRDPREGPGLFSLRDVGTDGMPRVAMEVDRPETDEGSEGAEDFVEEEDGESAQPVRGAANGEGSSGQPIELLSDDEDEEPLSLPPKRHDADDDLYEWSDQEDDGSPVGAPEIRDPWEGPRKYAEDFYAGGDDDLYAGVGGYQPREFSHADDDDDEPGMVLTPDIGAEADEALKDSDEESEPDYPWADPEHDPDIEEYSGFPSRRHGYARQLMDGWEDPGMDFYAGGDGIESEDVDPNSLTPRFEDGALSPVVEHEVIDILSDDEEAPEAPADLAPAWRESSEEAAFDFDEDEAHMNRTNATKVSQAKKLDFGGELQVQPGFAYQTQEDSVPQETPFSLPGVASYSPKTPPAYFPRAHSRTPEMAANGHVDWSWPPAFSADGATLMEEGSGVGGFEVDEVPEEDQTQTQQPDTGDASVVAENTAEAAVSTAAPGNADVNEEEVAKALAAEIQADLTAFDAVLQAAFDAANAAVEDQTMESMVDFGLEGVGEDGDAGVTAVEAEEAVERATLASLEGVLDTQNAEVVGPAEASGSAETSEESMLIVAAELEVEEEPQRAGVTGETGLEYGVEEEEEDAEGEVDELDDEDVVSVSASEYAVRRSQTREYTVEEARSERIWSQVPEESILADETANEVVEKVPEETADVDEAESKIPSQGTTQETLVAEDQVDFDGIISEKAVNEAVVQELNAAVAETTPLVDGEADNEMMVVIQETEVEQAQALEKVPGLVSDRTEETSSVEVAEYGSGASQLHEDPEMPVVEEPFSAAQPELVVSAEAASPSGLLDGVLPPIMANSEVPDPASVGHTPGATTPVASLMPFIVGRTFSDTGLFTPFGEGSGVTTPEPERDDEILQVPAQPDAMEPPEATVEQVDSDEVVEEVLLEDAISAEEAPQDEEPATKERVPAVVVEEPTSNPAALEELTPDVAEADTSIEHSDVQSVDLHPPSQPLLHPDPYPYSLSTPVGETLTSGLFDLQPEAPATNMSSEVLDILGQDLDLDDLELTYPEARSLSPEADRRIPVEPAFEAPVYRYPPLSIEDMPHLRLVHDGHTQPGVVSPRLGSEQLAHPGMPVAPGALAEEEEEDMPRPEEEEESGPEESQVTHSVPPLPMESDERDNLSKSSQPPQETGSSQAHPENGASEEAHAPVPVSSVSEEGATPGATQGAPQDSKKGIINGSDEAAPSLKRKRDSLPHLQLPDNTGNSKTSATDANETPAPAGKKSRKIRGKPKKKIFVKPKAEVVSDAGSSSSAASVAAQILASSSRVPSRSSSVASEPSPTAQKPSGLKIHIRPLRLENDRVFHHHGRKPRFPTPLPTLTRSRPKVQRQRKSIRPSKAEVEPEIKDTQERNVTPEPEVTREAEVPTPTESVPTAEAAPEAGSSLTPKPEYKSELAQDSHREQASEIEPSSLPPAPPTSPVKLAPSQSTVARTESTPQTPSLKSPRESQTQYSSPVTRSHCLYHVISIPREDNGPRITFMVPGCSLLDQDLINGEDIVDVREATREDERRAVDDIETLGFDEGLLVVLKALVNGDHQSIFYLPASSEDPSALNNNRRRLSAASTSKPGSNQTTPVSTRRKRLPANKTSIDRKGISRTSEAAPQSASVNGTVVGSRDGSPADTAESKQDASSSDSRETDSFGEDDFDQSRLPPKRRKYMSHEGSMTSRPQEIAESDERPSASGSNNPEGGEAPLKSVPAHRLRPRRSKRLSADASAYKPEDNSSHEESADDEERLTARRMKRKPSGGKRGTKRGREVTNGVEASGDRDVKRSRVEENVSSGNSGNARASNPIS